MFVSRALRSNVVTGAAVVLLLGATAAPAAAAMNAAVQAPPPFSAEERARAIIEPSVVFVEFNATGVVRAKATNEPQHTGTTTVTVRCSGFVVNHNGIAITDRNCAAPSTEMMTYWATDNIARGKNLTGEARTQFFQQGLIFTGEVPSEPPRLRLSAQGNAPTAGEGTDYSWKAEILGPANTNTNLVALRIPQSALPALEITTFATADDVLKVQGTLGSGYSPIGGKSLVLRSRAVHLAPKPATAENIAYKIEEEMPWESRGGVIADLNGKVVGVLAPDGNKTSAAYSAEAVTDQLKAAGVTNELSSYDRLFREALDDYYAGRYGDAVTKFEKVSTLQMNSTASHFRQQAEQRLDSEGDGSSPSALVIVLIVLGVLLAGCVVVIVIMVLRQRKNAAAGYPISASPYAYGSPVDAYQTYNYPVSVPPGQPQSGPPSYYDTGAAESPFGGFPHASGPPGPAEPEPKN